MEEQKQYSYEEILGPFIGREAILSTSMGEVIGVINKPNYELGYFDVMPHVVQEGDGKRCYLEREAPVRMPLLIFNNGKYFIRPLKNGSLEKKVETFNKEADKEKRRIGFDN